jgi:hypothetical protein
MTSTELEVDVAPTDEMDPDHLLLRSVANDLVLRDGLVARSALRQARRGNEWVRDLWRRSV